MEQIRMSIANSIKGSIVQIKAIQKDQIAERVKKLGMGLEETKHDFNKRPS